MLTAASTAAWPCRVVSAPLADLVVYRLELPVLTDSTTAVFDTPMIKVMPPPITRDYHQAFAGQWGYSLRARASAASLSRR